MARSNNTPSRVEEQSHASAMALLEELAGGASFEVLEEDSGDLVPLADIAAFAGVLLYTKQVPFTRENTGETYEANLYTFSQVRSIYVDGSPEVNGEGVPYQVGARRALWGNYGIDQALEKVDANGSDLVIIEHVGIASIGNGRTVNKQNIYVKRGVAERGILL